MVLILILALVSFGGGSGAGLGEEVLIGTLPTEQLSDGQDVKLSAEEAIAEEPTPTLSEESLEVEPLGPTEPSVTNDVLATLSMAPSGGSNRESFDAGAMTASGSMAGGNWDGMLQALRRHGLDIVITFDSTGSMSGEINQVKQQIRRIGSTLLTLVPKARISICTYRDRNDVYVVKGLPLTDNLHEIEAYLANIQASGGGDLPEAVNEGLRWSVESNQFRQRARKVILLFGDAPPHPQSLKTCLRIAADFNSQQKGVVSTVTCRSNRRLDQFVEIAQMGGGEAFLTADQRQIMTQLMVLVFGSQYRSKVLEAFELMDR